MPIKFTLKLLKNYLVCSAFYFDKAHRLTFSLLQKKTFQGERFYDTHPERIREFAIHKYELK